MKFYCSCAGSIAGVALQGSGVLMRRYLLSVAIAAFMLGASPVTGNSHPEKEDAVRIASAAVQHLTVGHGLRDEAAMVLIGTALIGLAAAVRRAA